MVTMSRWTIFASSIRSGSTVLLKTSRLFFCSKISWTWSQSLYLNVFPSKIVIGGMTSLHYRQMLTYYGYYSQFNDKVVVLKNTFSFFFRDLSHGRAWHNSYNCVRCRTYRVRFWYDVLAAALYQDMIVDEKNLKDSLHFNSLNVHCDTVMEMVTLHWQSTWHYKTDNKRLLCVFGFWEKIKRIIHRCLQLWWCSARAHWCCVEFEYQKDVCCGELENKESLVNGTTTLRITFAKLAYRFGSECTQLQVLTNVV